MEEVKRMDVREVIQALHFEAFHSAFESAYMEMNK